MNQPADRKKPPSSEQIEQHFGPICDWHFVDHFMRPDEADQCVYKLLQPGHHSRHAMIEGRCVVARRGVDSLP